MKKVALILALLIFAACIAWYIYDPGEDKKWVGHQSDDTEMLQPGAANTVAPVAMAMPEPTVYEMVTSSLAPSAAVENRAADAPAPGGWILEWSDEFDAPYLSMEYWTEIDRRDNYNEELQYYTPLNSCIEDGCLVLTARREELDGKNYTSGMVETSGKLEMLYGRIEARVSVPVSQGFFPAFWMTNDSGTHELDILEMVGCEPGNIYGVCHYIQNGRRLKKFDMLHIDDPEAFHVYALEWDKDEVRWYVDEEEFFSTKKGVPDEALYVLFTLAVGGEWPGSPDSTTIFPASMRVDYVRLYSRDTQGGTNDTA